MSGIAIAASTTPGSVATFSSCSSERSSRIASRISRFANTRAGTRMSPRAVTGISHSVSSSDLRFVIGAPGSSDVEDDPGAPGLVVLVHLQPMVGDGLHEMGRGCSRAAHRRIELIARQVERIDPLGNELLRLGEKDELAQLFGQQRGPVRRARAHLVTGGISRRTGRTLAEQLTQ